MSSNDVGLGYSAFAASGFERDGSIAVDGGAQAKALKAGFYKKVKKMPASTNNDAAQNNGSAQKTANKKALLKKEQTLRVFLKRSKKHRGDDFAEEITSYALNRLGVNAASCSLHIADDGNVYIGSEYLPNYRPLVSKKERKKLGFWGSNPKSRQNKDFIHSRFNSDQQKSDMCDIIVSNYLMGNTDIHAGNNGHFEKINEDGEIEIRVGAIDFGWGTADLCKDLENCKVDFYKSLPFFGKKGGHTSYGGIPTGHAVDYATLLNSPYFLQSLDKMIRKSEESNFWTESLENVFDVILRKERNAAQRIAYMTAYAVHLGISKAEYAKFTGKRHPAKSDVEDFKQFIIQKMTQRLNLRTDSLRLNKALLQMDLGLRYCPVRDGVYAISPAEALKELREVIQTRFVGRKVANFMPSFKPTAANVMIKRLIAAVKLQKNYDKELVGFCEEIAAGRNPAKVTVRPTNAWDQKERLERMKQALEARYQKQVGSEVKVQHDVKSAGDVWVEVVEEPKEKLGKRGQELKTVQEAQKSTQAQAAPSTATTPKPAVQRSTATREQLMMFKLMQEQQKKAATAGTSSESSKLSSHSQQRQLASFLRRGASTVAVAG